MADAVPRERDRALRGMRVLVTRPRHQSDAIAALIEARGGTALRFPAIEILPARDPDRARAAMACLDDYSMVIFVSPNAVHHGLALREAGPVRARVAAVGESSAAALERAGIRSVLRPEGSASSEALLALPALARDAIAGSRVLIVRAEGGRPLLGCTLGKRGARVTYAEVYRRAKPQIDASAIAERGGAGGIDTVVATSVRGLDNLFEMLGGSGTDWLKRAGYVVISERLAAHARSLGVERPPVVAVRADDEALVEALIRWRALHADDTK